MNWKQFLKSDWRKFYLFGILSLFFMQYTINGKFDFISFITFIIVIPLFIALISFFLPSQGLTDISESYKIVFKPQILATTVALFYLLVNFLLYIHDPNRSFYGIPTIFMLIPSYLISCLIVWIYDKIRKKNKK